MKFDKENTYDIREPLINSTIYFFLLPESRIWMGVPPPSAGEHPLISISLETERLILLRFSADDLSELFEYLSDDEVVKFEPYKVMSLEETNPIWKDTYIYSKLNL